MDDIVYHKAAILKLRRKHSRELRDRAFWAWYGHARGTAGASTKLIFAVQVCRLPTDRARCCDGSGVGGGSGQACQLHTICCWLTLVRTACVSTSLAAALARAHVARDAGMAGRD